ncbi:hypothetical protein SUBVAR_04422 [Subdoligranulum variabile DSM 15176]|uniref:Uncharacterized protein n=1 Tax=Subdoligranulum variabile DSM 15176 TaxID=411471 RepID=D1PJA2_9FIRM|nr:hypothetical protein SUBVAR_04422 [Subdoligranulum variabile DSM 15176]
MQPPRVGVQKQNCPCTEGFLPCKGRYNDLWCHLACYAWHSHSVGNQHSPAL